MRRCCIQSEPPDDRWEAVTEDGLKLGKRETFQDAKRDLEEWEASNPLLPFWNKVLP